MVQNEHIFLELSSGNSYRTAEGREDISHGEPKQLGLLSIIKWMLRGDVTSLQKHCRKNTQERKKRTKLVLT